MPPRSDDPRIIAYYEFLDFFKSSRLYTIQFHKPGQYAKLLTAVGKEPGEPWTEEERRTFSAYYSYFLDAFSQLPPIEDVLPEEALLLWLQLYTYKDLGKMGVSGIRKTLTALRADVIDLRQSGERPCPHHGKPGRKSRRTGLDISGVPECGLCPPAEPSCQRLGPGP